MAPVSARTPVSPPPPPGIVRITLFVTIWLPAPVANRPVLPPPPGAKLTLLSLRTIEPPALAFAPTLLPAPLRLTVRPVLRPNLNFRHIHDSQCKVCHSVGPPHELDFNQFRTNVIAVR